MDPNAKGRVIVDARRTIHDDKLDEIADALGTESATITARLVPFVGLALAGDQAVMDAVGIDPSRSFVVSHTYRWQRPFDSGEQVHCKVFVGDTWQKGSNSLGEVVTECRDDGGAVIHEQRSTFIEFGAPKPRSAQTPHPASAGVPGPIGPISRVQIARYAGATRDFNPIHVDEVYAREKAGLPSVVASGGLVLSLALDYLIGTGQVDRVRSFGGHLRCPVFPGDTLRVDVPATGAFVVTNDAATVVIEGQIESD